MNDNKGVTQRLIPALVIALALLFAWREVQQGHLAYHPQQRTRNAFVNTVDGSSTLMLEVNVPAQVTVDNHKQSIVPGGKPFALSLEAGTHTVSVQADGFLKQQFTVTLNPNETVTRTIDLPPNNASTQPKRIEPKDFVRAVQTARDGAVLELGEGDYRLGNGLEIKRSITLQGAGRTKTRVVSGDEIFVVKFDASGAFTAQDLSFEHDGKSKSDVVVIENGSFSFERCQFSGGVRNPEKDATTGDGLWVRGNAKGRVSQSVFSGNGLHGLEVQGTAKLTLQGNIFERNTEDGLVFFDDSGGTVMGNTSRQNGLHGISVAEQAKPTLENNLFERNTELGMRYSGTASGTASGNIARKNGLSGIAVNDSARPTLEGNQLLENASYGLYIAANARPTLDKNVLSENALGNLKDLRSGKAKP